MASFDENSAGNEWLQWIQAFEHAEWGIVINRADATTLEIMNAAFARMYGYSIDELRDQPIESIFVPEERVNLPKWIEEAHRKGHISYESRHLRKDGTVFPVSVDVTAVKDKQGKVLYRVVNVQDISQRKAAENALRDSEQRSAAIIATLTEGIVFHNADGMITLCNAAAERILGLSVDQILGRTSIDPRWRTIHEDGSPFPGETHPAMVTLHTGTSLSNVVMGIYKPDDTLTWISISTHALFSSENDNPYGVVVSFTDITDQKSMYELLEQRVAVRTRELKAFLEVSQIVNSNLELGPLLKIILEQLKKVIDYAGAGIAKLDGDDFVVVEYLGIVPRETMLGFRSSVYQDTGYRKVAESKQPVIIDDIWRNDPWLNLLRNITNQDMLAKFRDIHSWMGIPLISHDQLIGVLRLDHQEPGHFTSAHADLGLAFANQAAIAIENARLHEQALRLAAFQERQRLARELHDSVSQALYGIALGARTAQMRLETEPEKLAEPLDYILSLAEAGVSEMRALIFELRPESLQNEGLVAAITKQSDALHARYNLQVITDFGPEPDISLDWKEALYRITQEAMQNIAKHSHATKAEVRLHQKDSYLVLEIHDNGMGFDPGREHPGHLGLQSMQERVAQIGGTFTVVSQPGIGTTISVSIPL
ncbi:MAG: PAS domain S-box protein [Anaerolineales bacterium]|nr:PAS domain S-box protein [Anaerolineales bacterium]